MSQYVALNSDESQNLAWVRNDDGQPRLRWRRVAAFVLAMIVFNVLAMVLTAWYTGMPTRPWAIVVPCSGIVAYLVIAVELQRQRVLLGRWRFRLSLSTCLLLMLIAGIFFGSVGNEIRENQRGEAANRQLRSELEEVIRVGMVSIGCLDGREISCQITRADFSDSDLSRVIELASLRGGGRCEIVFLNLEGTSVTEVGLIQVSACRRMKLLALPSLRLTNEAISALAKCDSLQFLSLDERKSTPEQFAQLRQALPNVKVNGYAWRDRKP